MNSFAVNKIMQVRKARAVDVNGEQRPIAQTAAIPRSPIKSVARQNQSAMRRSAVAVGIGT